MNTGSRIALSVVVVAAGWAVVAPLVGSTALAKTIALKPVPHKQYNPAEINETIGFHEGRVNADPAGAIGWAMLGDAYIARSRESDSDDFAWKAEDAGRKSLKLRERGNVRGFHVVASSLLEQHRFQDTLAWHRHYMQHDASTADVLIEVGDLAGCEAILKKDQAPASPSRLSTMARLAAAKGDHVSALELFKQALAMAEENAGVGQQGLAWFETKAADEMTKLGQYKEAKDWYLRSLGNYPNSYKACLGLAKLGAQTGDWQDVVTYATLTLTIANSLDAKALLGDAAKAKGDTATMDRWYADCHAMYLAEVKRFDALGKGGSLHVKPIDRQFAIFCATHNLWANEALVAAKRDLANRPDALAKSNLEKLQALVSH